MRVGDTGGRAAGLHAAHMCVLLPYAVKMPPRAIIAGQTSVNIRIGQPGTLGCHAPMHAVADDDQPVRTI